MRWLSVLLAFVAAASLAGTQPGKVEPPKGEPPIIPGKFFGGAKRTPFTKIVESIKAGRSGIYRAAAPPAQVLTVPKRLSYWGNNQYGMCVTTESVFAVSDYSTYIGIPQLFVTDQVAIAWARSHGWLNGAELLPVIEAMQDDGIKDEGGVLRKAGKASTVDYSNEDTLKSAIAQGPVSIAIASGSLPSGAGNKSGWYAFGGRRNDSTDHCVSLHGYGPSDALFRTLNVAAPANAPAYGYYLFTWSTVGVVDHKWLMNTCAEAWVRNPTTTDLPSPTPPPGPSTITVTAANVNGAVDASVKITPLASGGTSPYLFFFTYGDGTPQDPAGTHTYKAAGTFTVTIDVVDIQGNTGKGTCVASIGTTPVPPGPNPPPGPVGSGTITWTINGVTSTYELFAPGSRQKLQDLIGPMSP